MFWLILIERAWWTWRQKHSFSTFNYVVFLPTTHTLTGIISPFGFNWSIYHILQGWFTVIDATVWLCQCLWSKDMNEVKSTGIYMMTSSNEIFFRVTGHSWGESTGHRLIPLTQASDAELWFFFFNFRLNKHWNKQSRRRWFETPPCSLWRHCNVTTATQEGEPCALFMEWTVYGTGPSIALGWYLATSNFQLVEFRTLQ